MGISKSFRLVLFSLILILLSSTARSQEIDAQVIVLSGLSSGTVSIIPPVIVGGDYTITLPKGSTDFGSTGGTSQVLKQLSAGAAITVGTLANTDIGLGNVLNVAQEPALGNPASSGYVLSSTTLGVRSWVAQTAGTVTGTGTSGDLAQWTGSSVIGNGATPIVASNVALLNAANLFTNNQTITKTTEQLRLAYDVSNYTTFTIANDGTLTITPGGTAYTLINSVLRIGGASIRNAGNVDVIQFNSSNVGFGTGTASARVESLSTTEQLRLSYNASNYNAFTTSSIGSLTIAATGTNPNIILTPGGTGYTILNGNTGIGTATPAGKLDVNGAVSLFGSSQGHTFINDNSINFHYSSNSNQSGLINYTGYSNGTTQFRDLGIYNGKNGIIIFVDGSSGYTGIGAPTPAALLEVGTTTFATTNSLVVRGLTAASATFYVKNEGAGPSSYIDGISITTGDAKFGTTSNFSWAAKSANTVYQAASDGFVVVSSSNLATNFAIHTIYSDASNPPTTVRAINGGVTNGNATGLWQSVTVPIKKGDYWKADNTGSSGSPTVYLWWVPLGTAG